MKQNVSSFLRLHGGSNKLLQRKGNCTMAQYSKVGSVPSSCYCKECSDHGLVHCAIKWRRGENLSS
jgi:hypothetical protein